MDNSKNSKKIFGWILLAAAILLALFFLLRGCEPSEDEPVILEMTQEELDAEIMKCEKETAYFQAKCFEDLAVSVADPDICDRVEYVQDTSYDSASFFTHKGVCLSKVAAVMNNDISLCERVSENQEFYELCTGLVTRRLASESDDVQICEDLGRDSSWYDDCLANLIKDEDDIGLCDNVPEEMNRRICYDMAYMNISKIKEDISYCEKADAAGNVEFCIGSYADKFDELEACDSLVDSKNVCVCYNLFFDEVTPATCQDLSGKQQENCQTCYDSHLFESW